MRRAATQAHARQVIRNKEERDAPGNDDSGGLRPLRDDLLDQGRREAAAARVEESPCSAIRTRRPRVGDLRLGCEGWQSFASDPDVPGIMQEAGHKGRPRSEARGATTPSRKALNECRSPRDGGGLAFSARSGASALALRTSTARRSATSDPGVRRVQQRGDQDRPDSRGRRLVEDARAQPLEVGASNPELAHRRT